MAATHELTRALNIKTGEIRRSTRLERFENSQPRTTAISVHELSHWVGGLNYGYLGDISLSPEGNSLARTIFYGYIPPKERSHIIAAGAVDVPGFKAFGYGMDKLMVERNIFYGGDTLEAAKATAGSILSDFGYEVLVRGAEIMSFLSFKGQKYFSGATVAEIMERAREELVSEGKDKYLEWKMDLPEQRMSEYLEDQERTIFEDTDQESRIILVKGVVVEKDESVCRICGEFDGNHQEDLHPGEEKNKTSDLTAVKHNSVTNHSIYRSSNYRRQIPKIEKVIR